MIQDLMFFMCIMGIFIVAYGVITHSGLKFLRLKRNYPVFYSLYSALYPGHAFNFELFRNVMNKGYWSIFGDFRILNELVLEPNCAERTDCYTHHTGTYFTLFTLMVYCVIANVLLINLLIAMFSYTFQNIQSNTDKIWKYQRYDLVLEHFDAPVLPPPLNVFGYIIESFDLICSKINSKRMENTLKKQSSVNNGESQDWIYFFL